MAIYYPLSDACPLQITGSPDAPDAKLRAWQLSLDAGLTNYTFAEDIDSANLFGIVWSGSVTTNSRISCTPGYHFFWIHNGVTIALESESAEIAIIGIPYLEPAFDPPLQERTAIDLPNPPTRAEPLTATLIALDLTDPDTDVPNEPWIRPAIVLTSQDGPRPVALDASGEEIKLPQSGTFPLFVSVPLDANLTFRDGNETRAIVCDFSVDSDNIGGLFGCTWRCPGKGTL